MPPDVVTPTAPSGPLNSERTFYNVSDATTGIEKRVPYHSHHLSFHFAYAGKDVGMNGICHSELAKGVRLQPDQLLAAMIDGSADSAIFPLGMFHVG